MTIDEWEHSADPVIFHDGVKIIHINLAACSLFKIGDCNQFDGVPIALLVDPEMRPLKLKRMDHLLKEINPSSPLFMVEYPFYRLDGTRFWAYVETVIDTRDDGGVLIRTRLHKVFEDWE